MAEALVFTVLQKIASAIGQEVVQDGISKFFKKASDLKKIEINVKRIQTEFKVMQPYLRKEDTHMVKDRTFEAWLEEVRTVASSIEDIIDEYAYLVRQIEGSSNSVSKTFRYIMKFNSWHEINTQIEKVLGQLDHLTKMKERYEITNSEERRSNNVSPNAWRRPNLSSYSSAIVDDKVVGNTEERAKLTQLLLNKDYGRVIISVYGMGGLGKTTLVNTIYKKEKKNFDCYACVSVSQSFQVDDLLRSISKQIFKSEIDHMDHRDIVERLQRYMQNKSYLIVVDDIWDKNAWLSLSGLFPVNNCRGKVVITTRIKDVALLADDNCLIEMRSLSQDESWDLFCTKAFGKLGEKICPLHLVDWAKKILDKCQGLPLVIVAIGSLLSFKGRTKMEWRIFYDQLSWELSNNHELVWVTNVLNLSYNHLPTCLKNCFLYCSLFPEDFVFTREMTIRLWVAEGFVEQKGTETTLEEVAETYLVELANRSLLQVVERDVNGRAESYRMHDLVRELCIARSQEELFAIVCNNQLNLKGSLRRVAVQSQCRNLLLNGDSSSKLRSFLLFNKQLPSSQIEATLSNFMLIRVLSLKFSNIEILPDAVFELLNLQYLDLSFTFINVIPKSLGKLKLLQTLDLEQTLVEYLPHEITKLRKLRHLVVLSRGVNFRLFNRYFGVQVPVDICGLKDLQMIDAIEANQNLVSQLGHLAMLRTIYLLKVKGSYISGLWFSFSKMTRLTEVGIYACDQYEVLNFEGLNPLPSLEKLFVQGKLEGGVSPSILSGFQNMRVLTLRWSGLLVDPLSSFSPMSKLTTLFLTRAYEGEVLTFCSGWFPNLKDVRLVDLLHLTQVNFEKGTTPSIQYLEFVGLQSLEKVPEGVRYLYSLQKMVISDMAAEFYENLRGDGQDIVKHIPDVRIYS